MRSKAVKRAIFAASGKYMSRCSKGGDFASDYGTTAMP
jgi:hypothetical protein